MQALWILLVFMLASGVLTTTLLITYYYCRSQSAILKTKSTLGLRESRRRYLNSLESELEVEDKIVKLPSGGMDSKLTTAEKLEVYKAYRASKSASKEDIVDTVGATAGAGNDED